MIGSIALWLTSVNMELKFRERPHKSDPNTSTHETLSEAIQRLNDSLFNDP
jgi:hypothetical protein